MLMCPRGEAGLGLCSCRRRSDSQTPWEQNPPCRPSTDGHRLGANFSPHTGHSSVTRTDRKVGIICSERRGSYQGIGYRTQMMLSDES